MVFNKHYITYPLLIIGAAAAIYLSGQYHQRKTDRAKAQADSAQTQASAIVVAKAKADSIARDSIAKLQNKVVLTKQITAGLEKQRDSLGKEVLAAKDTAQLVTALKAQVEKDSSVIKSKDSTIVAQGNQILFLTAKATKDSIAFNDLAELNANTNVKLAKAQADANPGLAKRVLKSLDLIGGTVVVCHFTHC